MFPPEIKSPDKTLNEVTAARVVGRNKTTNDDVVWVLSKKITVSSSGDLLSSDQSPVLCFLLMRAQSQNSHYPGITGLSGPVMIVSLLCQNFTSKT